MTRVDFKGKGRLFPEGGLDAIDSQSLSDRRLMRSRSVPPDADVPLNSQAGSSIPSITTQDVDDEEDGYGAGGILRPSKRHQDQPPHALGGTCKCAKFKPIGSTDT